MSEDKTVLIKTAYSYYQKGDWERAIEEYHKLADLDPKDLNVHNMLADIYAKKGDVKEALQQYDLVAQGFDQKNQVDKVLQVYKRMLKLVPNDPDLVNAVKNLIDKYLKRAAEMEEQEAEKALEIYRSVLKAEPGRMDANLQYAKLLMKNGQKFEAVETLMNLAGGLDPETQTGRLAEVLQAVTELDPLNVEAREKLAELFIKARQTAQAVKSLQDLIEIYISKNDLPKAEEAAQRAIDLGDPNTHYHLGVIYFNQQKFVEAGSAFVKFLKQQESHVGALKYLALSYLRLNQQAEAVDVYLRILNVYFQENLLDEAREVRQTILELDPQNEAVKQYALDQHLVSVEEAPAVEAPSGPTEEETAKLEEEEQQALLIKAQVFTEKGLHEQAIDVYLDMLKRWPQLPDIRIRLQQVYALVARAMEPEEKKPSAEEIKAELEKELREQMKRELEEQARLVQERQHELEMKREQDQLRLKQTMEEQAIKAAQDLQREMERKREMDQMQLRQELESKLQEQTKKSQEEELRHQLARELEDKQRNLEMERQKLEKEKASMEKKIREQIEREMKEKAEKETQLKAALKQEAEEQRREEQERKKYEEQKKAQEIAKAKVNQEIMSGMERLRMEKEKQSKVPLPPPSPSKPAAGSPAPAPVHASGGGTSQETLEDPFVRQTLADIYAKQGLYVEALKIYERILTDDPNNEDVKEKLRDILRLKGI